MSRTGLPHSLPGTAWKIARARFGGARVPLVVSLSLTHRCNLRCDYCAVWEQPPAEMDTATLLGLIDQLAAAGTERLSLGGGEPMLCRDLGVIIRHARQRGLTVNLLSNGHRVPQRVAELTPLDFLVISLDGPRALHDSVRGHGAHARAVAAIRAARAAGIEVWTTTVLTRHNLAALPAMLDFGREEGCRVTFLPVMEQSLKARNSRALAPDREAFRAAMATLIRETSRPGTPLAGPRALYRFYRDHWGAERPAPAQGAWHAGVLACQAGRLFCAIAPDGRLYPCNHLQGAGPGEDATAGFEQALHRSRLPDCDGCWCDSFIEANLLFRFHPGVILNLVRLLQRSRAPAGAGAAIAACRQ
jgi:MoaA/NifB/PqqE/SkfB family radical SAM enzyme